ncbi:uncharacterized protein LOC111930181 [Cyanistes caeruleus]|uniref:uncharacterized protein LOC111930181 n=1 Tax=Cyanistes caeruleus TaxID=156563 RepID=UPI000CDAD857|nr:uncharacterized protein LOC111930181 [Cyanistes caeruleus]
MFKGELLHVALLTKSLFLLPRLRQILSNSLTSKRVPSTLYCYLYPPSLRRTHQHKVMALFARCKELQEPPLKAWAEPSGTTATGRPCSKPGSALPARAGACKRHTTGALQLRDHRQHPRVPHTGIQRVHLCDTPTNRKGAQAPDTYQALLLLLGKAYLGCFHHLLYFSLSHGCYNLQLSRFLFNQTFISAKTQIQSPRLSYEKLRKASLNHAVNKKHMEVFEAFKSA